MSTFKLELDTDGAAFQDAAPGELVRILGVVAQQLEDGKLSNVLRDVNGNLCGYYRTDANQ